jgi:glycogen operon protein
LSWYDWNLDERRLALLTFTRQLIALRKAHPGLRRRKFFQGRRIHGSEVKDITWLRADGAEMTDEEWDTGWARTVGMRLGGDAIAEVDVQGQPITDDTLLVLLNASDDPVPFLVPNGHGHGHWELLLDTSAQGPGLPNYHAEENYPLAARSLVVLRHVA